MSNIPARIYFKVSWETTLDDIHTAIEALELFRIRSIKTTPMPEIHKKDIIVFVEKWYNGTRPLRTRLLNGGWFNIPNGIPGRDWGARMHEYPKPVSRNKNTIITRENYNDIDYIETDIPPIYSNTLQPSVRDNREERRRRNLLENREAMDAFIRDLCQEMNYMSINTPEKPTRGATAPGAPAKPAMPRSASSDVDIDSITTRLEDMFIDNTIHVPDAIEPTILENTINYDAIDNAIHYGNIATRRRKIGKRPANRT